MADICGQVHAQGLVNVFQWLTMWTQWFVYVRVELPWAAPGEVWLEQLQGAGECSAFQIYRHSSGVRRSVLRCRSFRVGGAAWKVVKTEKPKMDGGRATNPAILRCCTWGPEHTDRRVLRKRRIEYDMVLFIWYELIWYFVYIDDMYIYIYNYRRKFRSQTSDNMERWKAEQGRGREKRKIRREKIRGERVRRQKIQMREKVGKSRNTVFFQWFGAPEGRKVGSLKRRVRSQLARWEMKNCTPLWREAHFEVKMYKTLQRRTTFGSWDVEKVHAVVVRSTFRSQNVQNTSVSDHFWKLRCRKSARRCGAKHISKSKCTKHLSVGPLLEVEMSKKCTPLWREAHFEVKMLKTPGVRTTFGGSDVASLRFTTLHYVSLHYTPLHYITLHNTPQHYNYNYTTKLHYAPLHSTTLNYTTLHYTTLHYTTLHNTTTTTTQLHSTTLNYTTLHYTTLHSTTLNYATLHYLPLHFTTLLYTTPHYTTTTTTTTQLHSTTLHYTKLHYATLHYTTLHYTTFHYTPRH